MHSVIIDVGESVRLYNSEIERSFTVIDAGENKEGRWYKQGGSAICFDAYYIDHDGFNHYGRLKKFYLADEERNFTDDAAEYISSYKQLQEIVSKAGGKSGLYAFVPEFEIYYDEDKCPYIWTNNIPMRTFGEICKHLIISDVRTEDALYEIVTALKSVTDCVRILHENDLIHGDINPENFGFYLRDRKILSDAVSLFDLNTLRYVWQQPKWFTAPYYDEVTGDDSALNKADIKAIGITLCKAIGLDDDKINKIKSAREEFITNRKTRGAVQDAIYESDLFIYKGAPRDSHVIEQLVTIISETVTNVNSKLISSCSKLIQRLQLMETLLLPDCTKDELGRGLGIEIVNKEVRRKDKIHKVFQYLLYERPLYIWENENPTYGIAIIGFGLDAQNFLDVCLEIAQSMNKNVVVNVWGSQKIKSEKSFYLKERPALNQFFLIDDNEDKLTGEAYGTIRFNIRGDLSRKEEIERIISTSEPVNYIYIAAGNDTQNSDIANALSEILDGRNISINAQCDKESMDTESVHYVFADMDVKTNADYVEIERMSFNTHLVWSGSLNTALSEKKDKYESDYYHASCLSSVLSIKYKLRYLGIDLEKGLYNAAIEFMNNPSITGVIKREMIAAEHRRWVTEKICDGWIGMSVEDSVQYNDTKDTQGKRHICIVRSNADFGLTDNWVNHSSWDEASEDELCKLDELDSMSVRLHQAYRKYANTDELDSLFNEGISDYVMDLSNGMDDVQDVFIEWIECVKELQDAFLKHEQETGKEEWSVSEYYMLYHRLLHEIKGADINDELKKEALKNKINTVNVAFTPIARSLKYHDYKKNDSDLINNIPFILSYSNEVEMIVPMDYKVLTAGWDDARPSELFSYVAAATLVNPKVLYLTYTVPANQSNDDVCLIEQKELCIKNYFVRKRLQTVVKFQNVGAPAEILDLMNESTSARWFFVEDNGNLDIESYRDGLSEKCISYKFDMQSIEFKTDYRGAWINSIKRNVGITARDVAEFLGRSTEVKIQPSFRRIDIRILFGIYKSDRVAWRDMCALLKKSDSKNADVIRFNKIKHDSSKEEKDRRVYVLPFTCYKSASDILGLFKEHNIIGKESYIYRYSVDACKILVFENSGCDEILKKIFSKLDILSSGYEYELKEEKKKYILRCDSLSIENIRFDFATDEKSRSMLNTFRELQRSGFIRIKEKKESFDITYGSRQIKAIFMEEGNFLEIYTYYKSKELNTFDDVVTGIKFMRPDEIKPENEIDCFVTKGFQTIIVECKARSFKNGKHSTDELRDIKEELSRKVKKYGINGKGLLVIDSETGIPSVADFENVVVCSNFKKIINIGQVVIGLMKESFNTR